MKKNDEKKDSTEVLKTVAQAWLGHSGNPRPSIEWDAHRSNNLKKPTRFKLEAEVLAAKEVVPKWNFGQSLWDSYEIVTLCDKLERSTLLHDDQNHRTVEIKLGMRKRRRPTKNKSLRKLFGKMSKKSEEGRPEL